MPLPALALCLEYPLALRGGVSVLVEELARGLAPHLRIVLVSPDENADVRWEPSAVSCRTARELAGRLRDLGVDIAHFHSGGVFGWGMRQPGHCPIPYAARMGIRCVTTVHRAGGLLDGFCGPAKPLWFRAALLPFAWLGKTHVLSHTALEICVSRQVERAMRRRYAPFADRFRVVYHSRLHVNEAPASAPREPVILHVGHLAFAKGQHVLVEAFAQVAARHPTWRLRLVGPAVESRELDILREQIARSGVCERIDLAGSRSDVNELMRAAAIYVQPSLEEALGLALQEALAAGCPCIGSDAGGIPELLADGDNGLLVPRGDAAALARALDRLMSDAVLRAKLSERARPSIVERGMTSEHMIQQHLDIYREVLTRR